MSREYHEQLAKELGLKILYSPTVDKMLDQISKLVDRGDLPDDYDRDEGYLSAILHVLGVCAKNPGRKTWVLGKTENMGYSEVHFFAVDSVREATVKLRAKLEKIRGRAA